MTQPMMINLERDGERREFPAHGGAVLGTAGGMSMMLARFEPGWRWSTDIGAAIGADSCQTRHLGYVLSGGMHVVMDDDGSEYDLGPGDMFDLPAGHDAYVVGGEPCIMLDTSVETAGYAMVPGASTDRYLDLVRQGYRAFNARDLDTLQALLAQDVCHHVPGNGPLAGAHKGLDAVLGYYGSLASMTDDTFRAHLLDVHGDGSGHVVATHQTIATRNGVTRVSRGSILFTFVGDRATDLLELRADIAGDDAFLS